MRKLVLLLVAALLISGAVWGQAPSPGKQALTVPNAGDGLGGLFDWFYAVPTVSTESRYSAGIFSTDIDNYIDVNWHDPKIGTFFFLGGYPGGGQKTGTVDDTDIITEDTSPAYWDDYALSVGFGKTFSKFYIAAYYGGGLVDAWGTFTKGGSGTKDATESSTNWRNKLAVLFGTSNLGAFRFDLTLDTSTDKDTYDGKISGSPGKNRVNAPTIAFTWGGMQLAGLDPYVSFGIKFNDKDVYTTPAGSKRYEWTETKGARIGVQAGVNKDLDENSSLFGDVAFAINFKDKYKGDKQANPSGVGAWEACGGLGFGIQGGYHQKMHFGKISVGFEPNVGLGYNTESSPVKDAPSNNFFEFGAGVGVGARYTHNEKVAFYTGAQLLVFDWVYATHSGGKPKNEDTAWRVTGLTWNPQQWDGNQWGAPGGNLGFGMVITPAPGLAIGTGLNTFLDRLFYINLREMHVGTGDFFKYNSKNGNSDGNIGGWFNHLFDDLKFDLTLSYKF